MSVLPPGASQQLAAIIESSDDAIISKDLDGVVTTWNRSAEQLFGYSAREIVGHSIRMLIPADRVAEEDDILSHIRRGERVPPFDTERRRKDGTVVDVSVSVSPIRDATGTTIGASTIARDITHRKQVEAQLKDAQYRLTRLAAASATLVSSPNVEAVLSATIDLAREVFAADGYAMWRVDAEGNWRAVRTFGVSDEFSSRIIAARPGRDGLPFNEPLICEDVTTIATVADMRAAYAREAIASMIVFPLRIRGEWSGTIVFYSRRHRHYQELDVQVGSALASLASASLTTAELYEEQRQARETADRARRQASFLAEAGSVLGASLDYGATLKAVAQLAVPTIADWCAVDVLGPAGELERLAVAHIDPQKIQLAQRLQERYPPDPNTPGGVREVLRTGEPTFMSRIPAALIDAVARDDEHRHLLEQLRLTSYMCVPLLQQGKPIGAITFVSAESGREYSEEDLRVARDLAARASLAVENARSYMRANEASQLKDEFLATLSHELRTPLSAVLGYARLLRAGTLTGDKMKTALEVVERNATALKQIIEDVLDVSRIVAGRFRLNVEPIDLPAILRDACASVMPAADAKGVRVESIMDPLTTPVLGDADRLQQIVWNLLSNAIKFTARGGKVQVQLAQVNSHVEVTVSDTGRGIAADFLPFVFERFRQADSTFTREQSGLGLGLSIAKHLTEAHGGTISAASEGVGRGATFIVKLPLMIVHPVPEPNRREQPRADRNPPAIAEVPRLEGVSVLVVDDDADSLNLVRNVLEGAGANVTTAPSASIALESLRSQQPSVLLADIGMPGMDGLQFIRAVRQMDEPVRSTPAAAFTAYARSQDRITSLVNGFQTHLVKPIDPVELIVAVASLARRGLGV